MENIFKLGEKVIVTGRYEKAEVHPQTVDQVVGMVSEMGVTVVSNKYEVNLFDKAKVGFIVGKRTIPTKRKHYRDEGFGWNQVVTKPIKWENVYLVACDMRGLMYVPESEIVAEDLLGETRFYMENYEGWSEEEVDCMFSGL